MNTRLARFQSRRGAPIGVSLVAVAILTGLLAGPANPGRAAAASSTLQGPNCSAEVSTPWLTVGPHGAIVMLQGGVLCGSSMERIVADVSLGMAAGRPVTKHIDLRNKQTVSVMFGRGCVTGTYRGVVNEAFRATAVDVG